MPRDYFGLFWVVNDPYADQATGFLPGEAVAALALEAGNFPGPRVLAALGNSDAYENVAPAPLSRPTGELLERAMSLPQLEGRPVTAICPHASGTTAHDRWTTARALGMQAGMALKWFRVVPAHLTVMEQHFGEGARDVPMWCFNCGATPAPACAMALATDRPGLPTDQDDRMTGRYLALSRELLAAKGPGMAARTHAPSDRLPSLLSKARPVAMRPL